MILRKFIPGNFETFFVHLEAAGTGELLTRLCMVAGVTLLCATNEYLA